MEKPIGFRKPLFVLAAFVAAILVGLAFFGMTNHPVMAQTEEPAVQTNAQPERFVDVMGSGSVSAQPDMATVRFGVTTQAETAEAALSENSVQMQSVISATIETGIAAEDVQTQGISLQPVYDSGNQPDSTPTLQGYRADNTVVVTVHDVASLGSLLDAVTAAGSNRIDGISFEISNRSDLLAEARRLAMEDAQMQAEQLANLAGAELGQVLEIQSVGVSSPPRTVSVEQAAAAGVPVSPGTQSVDYRVEVKWQLNG